MRRQDKVINMVKANKAFQKRFDEQGIKIKEEAFEYTPIPDFHPRLSKLLK